MKQAYDSRPASIGRERIAVVIYDSIYIDFTSTPLKRKRKGMFEKIENISDGKVLKQTKRIIYALRFYINVRPIRKCHIISS